MVPTAGAWTQCRVCGLGMKNQQTLDFSVVSRALETLKEDLQGQKPHSKLMTAAIEKVTADVNYQNIMGTKAPTKLNDEAMSSMGFPSRSKAAPQAISPRRAERLGSPSHLLVVYQEGMDPDLNPNMADHELTHEDIWKAHLYLFEWLELQWP